MKLFIYLLLVTFFIVGCSQNAPTPQERKAVALSLAYQYNLQEQIYNTKKFDIFSLQTNIKECKNIKVYIEGDGLAWISRNRVSKDPTPINPLGLKLMNLDNSSCKIYLARPCQYIDSKLCEKKYWTSHRFSNEVIKSYTKVLDNIKKEYHNESFSLVGYSGGAAVALLTAVKRDDIKTIITIAGNLDHTFWTKHHQIDSLTGSLNPINSTQKLEKIPQYHLIGQNDHIIPKKVFDSYKRYFKHSSNIHHQLYDATHTKNWEEKYKNFLKEFNEN